MNVRTCLVLAGLAVQCVAASRACAQPYPSKPVRLIVSAGTGSTPDLRARQMSAKLAEVLAQAVVVDNRPGGNGFIAVEATKAAPSDGYTLLLGAQSIFSVNPWLFKSLPYRPDEDFAPVTLVTAGPAILVINPNVPAATLEEFLAYAKARPGKLDYATSGRGAIGLLLMEQLKLKRGVEIIPVAYKATGAELTDLMAGHIAVGFNFWSVLKPHVRSGKLRALAVANARRLVAAPEIPTFAELGHPELEGVSWTGLFVAAGTPRPVIARLHSEFARILVAPDMRDSIIDSGAEPGGNTPEEFAAFLRADRAKMGRFIRDARILPE